MKQAHVSKLLGFITGTLIAAGGLQAQIVGPPMPPIFPTPPITSTLPLVGVLATDPTALGGTSSGAFTLTLNAVLPTNLPVTLAISGTASYTVDYNLETNGTVLAPIVVSTVIEPTNVVTIPAGFLAVDILVQPLPETVNTGVAEPPTPMVNSALLLTRVIGALIVCVPLRTVTVAVPELESKVKVLPDSV